MDHKWADEYNEIVAQVFFKLNIPQMQIPIFLLP